MKAAPAPPSRPPVTDLETGTPAPVAHEFVGLKTTDRAVREEILHRAYAIWEGEGHPPDRKLANWLEAEAEVRQRT
jgi:hypothetical protein